MKARLGQIALALLWIVLIGLALRFTWQSGSVATRRSDGFAAYYTAARLIRAGSAGPRLYDDAWFSAEVARTVPGVRDIYNANPPTTALLLLPLSGARYAMARTIWIWLNVALLAVTLLLILRETGLRGPPALIFASVALASQPLQANMRQGQVYVLLLALATLVWIGLRRCSDRVAGAALGVMIAVKTAGLLLPILLLSRRRWRSLFWASVSTVALSLTSLFWFNAATWRAYVQALMRLRNEPDLSVSAYQTVPSLFRHLFAFDPTWNPDPLTRSSFLATTLTLLAFVGLLALTVLFTRTLEHIDLQFAALLTLSVLLSPVSLDYHYTLLLLPLAIVLSESRSYGDWRVWTVVAFSAALTMTNLPYTSPRFVGGVWIVLGYPKLVGGLLLWGTTMWLAHRAAMVSTTDSNRFDHVESDRRSLAAAQ
ncbi:MAG: glycosyltransferase family 87 protein [Nitrolancea sp.]